jgi:hypothetical protein
MRKTEPVAPFQVGGEQLYAKISRLKMTTNLLLYINITLSLSKT